ncbi:acyl-CoA binding protein [Serendipita vermifera]|nr:acyl-CoA binding protein [Serendipita vermifera]
MSDKFEKAVEIVQELSKYPSIQPTDGKKLQLYGWYKTVTVGTVDRVRPSLLDQKGQAKWDAWNEAQTTLGTDCKRLYVEKVVEVLERHNVGKLGPGSRDGRGS